MIAKCPLCGKVFDVLWPNLWRFRRDRRYLCSWGCMRALDDQKGENKDMALSKAQKQAVIEMLLNGENPNEFIKNCGIKNPTCTVWNLKQYLKKYDSETWEKLQPKPAAPAVEIPEAPVKAEELFPEFEHRITGIETQIGDFQYFRRNGYLDWTPLDGNGTVSMTVEEWKDLLKLMPLIARRLGVGM